MLSPGDPSLHILLTPRNKYTSIRTHSSRPEAQVLVRSLLARQKFARSLVMDLAYHDRYADDA